MLAFKNDQALKRASFLCMPYWCNTSLQSAVSNGKPLSEEWGIPVGLNSIRSILCTRLHAPIYETRKFLEAINIGADLCGAPYRFLLWLLESRGMNPVRETDCGRQAVQYFGNYLELAANCVNFRRKGIRHKGKQFVARWADGDLQFLQIVQKISVILNTEPSTTQEKLRIASDMQSTIYKMALIKLKIFLVLLRNLMKNGISCIKLCTIS